jgi:hypothetical protein
MDVLNVHRNKKQLPGNEVEYFCVVYRYRPSKKKKGDLLCTPTGCI